MTELERELVAIGAGLGGLQRGLAAQRSGAQVLVLDRKPIPGDSVRTLRSEGFSCELGPFALDQDAYDRACQSLENPPPRVVLQDAARFGQVYSGKELLRTPVEGSPVSGRSGTADLVSAYRRELGEALWLGRKVTALQRADSGMRLQLGEDPTTICTAAQVDLCMGVDAAAKLLAPLDARLHDPLTQLRQQPRAFVFLGTWQDQHVQSAWHGYGLVTDPPQATLREAIFCSNAFAHRAVAGKALVRIEVDAQPEALDEEAIALAAETELRKITGWGGTTLFRRVHRFTEPVRDGAFTECQARLRDLCEQVPELHWTP